MQQPATAPAGVTLPLNLGLNDGTYVPQRCLEVLRRYTERTDFRNYSTADNAPLREAIATGTFKTIWGETKYKNQLNVDPWAVGQWQNGEVVGVYPANKAGAKPVQFPKPAWS